MSLQDAVSMPIRTRDPELAKQELQKQGCVILDGAGPSAQAAREVAELLFAEQGIAALPEPAKVFDGGEKDPKRAGLDHTAALFAHTDGFAYGDLYPDYMCLTCVTASPSGGENFLVDGYAVYAELAARFEQRGLDSPLTLLAVDQTETGMQASVSPIVQRTPNDRLMVRRTLGAKPARDSLVPGFDQSIIDEWEGAVDEAATHAPRFLLAPGSTLIADNYRIMHGREGYSSMERFMWRVWVWTHASLGVPDIPLHSDTRFAAQT